MYPFYFNSDNSSLFTLIIRLIIFYSNFLYTIIIFRRCWLMVYVLTDPSKLKSLLSLPVVILASTCLKIRRGSQAILFGLASRYLQTLLCTKYKAIIITDTLYGAGGGVWCLLTLRLLNIPSFAIIRSVQEMSCVDV